MKRFSLLAAILILMTAISALAAPKPSTANVPAFPGTLANARYVYVASYDGDQFNTNLLPEDREAISCRTGRHSEVGQTDARVPAVPSRHHHPGHKPAFRRCDGRLRRAPGPRGNYLWRVMGRDGLQSGETPLVTQFEKGFESVQKHK